MKIFILFYPLDLAYRDLCYCASCLFYLQLDSLVQNTYVFYFTSKYLHNTFSLILWVQCLVLSLTAIIIITCSLSFCGDKLVSSTNLFINRLYKIIIVTSGWSFHSNSSPSNLHSCYSAM